MNARNTILRWYKADRQDPEDWDDQLLMKQKKFKQYKYSIYVLNRVSVGPRHLGASNRDMNNSCFPYRAV